MRKSVSIWEALSILKQQQVNVHLEKIPLSDALDRIIADDFYAVRDIPPFDKSPFDGFALKSVETPGTLYEQGMMLPGTGTLPVILPGHAVKVFTGSPVPESADVVVKMEDVSVSLSEIKISSKIPSGTNIIKRGEDLSKGELIIRSGMRLSPGHLGLLAGQGISSINVFRKPKIALIPTGSELLEPGEEEADYKIYNSSSFVIKGYLQKMGFEVHQHPSVQDNLEIIKDVVYNYISAGINIVITTGGASIGEFDFSLKTAEELKANVQFWKVNMKPGGALVVSTISDVLLVGLSGNPAAAIMSLLVVLRPHFMKLTGAVDLTRELFLPLKDDMTKTSSAVRLLRGNLNIQKGKAFFSEHKGRGNGNISSFVGCDLIGLIPENNSPLYKGDIIRALWLAPELRG